MELFTLGEEEYLLISGLTLIKEQSTQSAFICSKLATETLEQGVKYVQS